MTERTESINAKGIAARFDRINNKNFDEPDIRDELKKSFGDQKELDFISLSEYVAFSFCEGNRHKDVWNEYDYFFPILGYANNDGTSFGFPSVQDLTPEMIDYWHQRGNECNNPILKARYLGLVWEFQEKICNKKPEHELCRDYIADLLKIANENYYKYKVHIFCRLERALSLALSLNATELMEECKKTIINYEKNHAEDSSPGMWGHAFDLLVFNKKVNLTDQEEQGIINDLEERIKRLSATDSTNADPWATERAVEKLAKYYRKKQKNNDVERVIHCLENEAKKTFPDSSAIQIHSWLDKLHKIYGNFNLNNDAERIAIEIKNNSADMISELKPISRTVNLDKVKLDNYVKEMTSGTQKEILIKIAGHYIPKKEQITEQVYELSKKTPLLFLLPNQTIDHEGRPLASIGSLQDDLEGNIAYYTSKNLNYSTVFLGAVIQEIHTRKLIRCEDVLNFIKDSPVIKEERLIFFQRALDAYFSSDYLTFIHLSIPQIEKSMRNIIELSGERILKESKAGGYHYKTFDEVLRDQTLNQSLGEDYINYFRILYTDPRGWNLRNKICHGISPPNEFNRETADRVFHSLLCLGLIGFKEETP